MTDTADSPVRMGIVVGGSLSRGVEVRLDATFPVERVKVGGFVTIRGQSQRFFGIVSDVALETSDQSVRGSPPDMSDPFVASVISGTGAYAIVNVVPQLVLNNDPLSIIEGPQSARSIPAHFTPVFQASDEDIRMVFGAEDERRVWVGSPLDMEETRVCLDLEELVKRSNGVFGKSGTGKSFLTRILLAGILQKGVAVNLVFDMPNEYGWQGRSEWGRPVHGPKQRFPSQGAGVPVGAQSALSSGRTRPLPRYGSGTLSRRRARISFRLFPSIEQRPLKNRWTNTRSRLLRLRVIPVTEIFRECDNRVTPVMPVSAVSRVWRSERPRSTLRAPVGGAWSATPLLRLRGGGGPPGARRRVRGAVPSAAVANASPGRRHQNGAEGPELRVAMKGRIVPAFAHVNQSLFKERQ